MQDIASGWNFSRITHLSSSTKRKFSGSWEQNRWCAQSTSDDFSGYECIVTGFERLREEYQSCPDFGEICHVTGWFCSRDERVKQRKQIAGSYTPLPVSSYPWQDVSLDFILGSPKTQKRHDSILVAVDRFSKMAHFIPYFKTSDASCVIVFFFDHIIKLHGLPKTMVQIETLNLLAIFCQHYGTRWEQIEIFNSLSPINW